MRLETVHFDREDPVGIIRLNRPERMNAVIEQMYLDLQAVLDSVEREPAVRALVLTGCVWHREKGDKQAFCAGADLKKHAAGDRTAWQKRAYIRLAHETTARLYRFPKPVIAAVNGPARGAGAEMALNCDFVLMAEDATLAFTETSLGTCVGGAVTGLLPRWVGLTQARRLIYTGAVVDGREAVALGLALGAVPVDRLLPEAIALARALAEKAPISLAFAKELINRAPERDQDTVLLAETEAILACMGTQDWHEGVAAFAEKRKPSYQGK